jgi:RsmE family RNA methyltransferase
MNVVLLEAHELVDGVATIDGPRARHVLDVLATPVGGTLRIGVIDGPLGTAEVREASAERVTLACMLESTSPPAPRVDLILALPRPKVLARLFSPIAQLGVRHLVLTGAWKVERFYFDAHVLSPAEHVPLLIEGLAQARDTRLPRVSVHRSLRWFVSNELATAIPDAGTRIVLDPSATTPIEAVLPRDPGARVLLAVGPEGGYTGRELRELGEAGFSSASLGPRVLRSDVATIALLARVHAALGG